MNTTELEINKLNELILEDKKHNNRGKWFQIVFPREIIGFYISFGLILALSILVKIKIIKNEVTVLFIFGIISLLLIISSIILLYNVIKIYLETSKEKLNVEKNLSKEFLRDNKKRNIVKQRINELKTRTMIFLNYIKCSLKSKLSHQTKKIFQKVYRQEVLLV